MFSGSEFMSRGKRIALSAIANSTEVRFSI